MLFQKDFRINEKIHIDNLVVYLRDCSNLLKNIHYPSKNEAIDLRRHKHTANGIDILMKIYPLHQEECRGLMELAESLIRTPDKSTFYHLLADKVANRKWFYASKNINILIYSLGLSVAKYILKGYTPNHSNKLQRLSLPFINYFTQIMIKKMALQFILAEDMTKGMERIKPLLKNGHSFSFDMLGEIARTQADADRYFKNYSKCIEVIKKNLHLVKDSHVFSVSLKLTSICPKYEPIAINDYFNDVYHKTLILCQASKAIDIPLFIDAEEADKLEFSFKIFEKLLTEDSLKGWSGFGIVVQAYSKRAFTLIDDIYNLAKTNKRIIYIRLVKGAYWDSEIKLDQINGVTDFSLFTRKEHTDISYMACAKKLSLYTDYIYPCFATHNIHTINFVKAIMQNKKYEYQCLFGMGEDVYLDRAKARFYAPIGNFKTVLPYLIRRLLENGSKHNFINTIIQDDLDIEEVIENPILKAAKHGFSAHELIKLPANIFVSEKRDNSKGVDMADLTINQNLVDSISQVSLSKTVYPIINGVDVKTKTKMDICNPSTGEVLGIYYACESKEIDNAFKVASEGYVSWSKTTADYRANILEKLALSLETDKNIVELTTILAYEAGKTIKDSILEIREAVDFLRYYAARAREDFSGKLILPSVDGEENYLKLESRGVFVSISPWNFPLAIFLGQIVGALAAGNTVVSKPAEDTNMIAYVLVKKFFEAGLPTNVLQMVTGEGKIMGNTLVSNKILAGVAFTGSDVTARGINRILAKREDYIVPLIAETGGQNCMIVDSTALLDQVARDVVISSFQSAGQRCSSLRVLYLQDEIADETIKLIQGVAELLKISYPWEIETDVGPLINQKALAMLMAHKEAMSKNAKLLFEIPYNKTLKANFFTPCAFEIKSIAVLEKEVFGPILHIIRYKAKDLANIIKEINSTGYGLTFGLHTRIDEKILNVINQVNCGNLYVNRNQIGAIVGSQPFGGRGKSGTGPKAGGPFYLHRFATEKTISIDITAQGGNRHLLNI